MENPGPSENLMPYPQAADTRPPKYGIFQSLEHMLGDAKSNWVTLATMIVVSFALSALVAVIALFVMSLMIGPYGLLFVSGTKLLVIVVVGLLVYTLLYALVYAFTTASMAYALSYEGLGIRTALQKALSVTPRVATVNAWVAVIVYWPLLLAAALPLILLAGNRTGYSSIALFTPFIVVGAIIWTIIAQLRYALTPYVAIFEPELSINQTLKRSRELLKHGGQWFIVKGVLLLTLIMIALSIATKTPLKDLQSAGGWAANILLIVLAILIEGAMVMLYLHRSGKQDATAPKSPKLLAIVIVILIGLIGLSAAKKVHTMSPSGQAAFLRSANDSERRVDMRALAGALECYYDVNGYYPATSDISTPGWASQKLTESGGSTAVVLDKASLSDPNGNYVNAVGSDYHYAATPLNCVKCAGFELTSTLNNGEPFKISSLNNVVKASSSPAPATETNIASTSTPQSTATASKTGSASILYRIATDGGSAQTSPVRIALTGVTNVDITVNLQCLSACRFRLVSETYAFSDTTIYTSSQQIKYRITKPGNYTLRNEFTSTAFLVSF